VKQRFWSVLRVFVMFVVLVPLNASGDASGASRWRTIASEDFEGTFPPAGGKWITYDGSYTSTQGAWGKDPNGYNSAFAARPNPGVATYRYNTQTWMRYGPFSLAKAKTARMLFKYWLDTEEGYDFLGWAYSCNGVEAWTARTVTGNGPTPTPAWTTGAASLKSCAGRTNVYVQFTFHSDQSVNMPGVWVDSVQIQTRR
jgi:hypothetical protein